jgi:uncharacterized membrane protein
MIGQDSISQWDGFVRQGLPLLLIIVVIILIVVAIVVAVRANRRGHNDDSA